MNTDLRSRENGFSLVELLIAMVVTLIVTASIYGLMAGGQNAFRREPEVSERQQNIRYAMDLIMRDVANAGSGMPAFVQTFTTGLDACAGCPAGPAPMGLNNQRTDEVEILANSGSRDNEPVCFAQGGANAATFRLLRGTTNIPIPIVVMIIMEDGTWTFRNIIGTNLNNGGPGPCTTDPHVTPNINQGAGDQTGMNTPGGSCGPNAFGVGNAGTGSCNVTQIGFAEMVRYRIRNGADGVPNLERIVNGDFANPQIMARGIEDLQVTYTRSDGVVCPGPAACLDGAGRQGAPPIVAPNYPTLITDIQVTLSARSDDRGVQGMTTDASAQTALRGSLTSHGAPRATLIALTTDPNPGLDGVNLRWR